MSSRDTTMRGGGYYDRHSRIQGSVLEPAAAVLARAAEAVSLPSSGPLVITDYGSATGRNSAEPVDLLVTAVRRRAERVLPVLVVHDDQPGNDFAALFSTLTGAESYLGAHDGVFACAVGRSFHEQILPEGFVHLGWSSAAAHWLSVPAAAAPGHLWAPRAPRALFAAHARRDWATFFRQRARELAPGGQLVLVVASADERGASGGDHVLDAVCDALTDLVARGALRGSERDRMTVPMYFRDDRELVEPFKDGELVLAEHSTAVAPDPLWLDYDRTRDAAAYGDAFSGWVRAFSEGALFSVLDLDRSPAERRALADETYAAVNAAVRANPAAFRCAWRLGILRLSRR
jgi:hypothetical protein